VRRIETRRWEFTTKPSSGSLKKGGTGAVRYAPSQAMMGREEKKESGVIHGWRNFHA